MVWLGYEIGRLFGWSKMDSIFLGAMLSISSTTIILKALSELGKSKQEFAQLAFGILIIEDILGIAMIALLSGIAMTGALKVRDVGLTLGRLTIFLVTVLLVGLIVVPKLIAFVARFKSNEMLLVTVLGLCFGVSLLAAKLGYSVALGAFLIGAVIAEAREIHRIEGMIEPVRDMFSAIFFVAIGLLIDPKMLIQYWLPILIITLAVVAGKVFACSFGAFAGGNDSRTSLRVGMSLAQIGEFSFIIASLGTTLKVTSDFLYPIAVAVSAITTLLTPYLIRSSDGVINRFDRLAPRSVVNYLELYTQRAEQFGKLRHTSMTHNLIRRWTWQMILNALLIAAVFLAAAFMAQQPPEWNRSTALQGIGFETLLWFAAILFSLPLFIATSRKLQALGLLVADLKVPQSVGGVRARAVRSVVAQAVPIAGTVVLGVYVLLLSSALLPPLKVLPVLLAIVALVAWLFRRSFIRVYSMAQAALKETLNHSPPQQPDQIATALPSMLRQAILEIVSLKPESPAVGKLISELQLRTKTGASIVAIERKSTSIVNPVSDEELQSGDQILLLGTKPQLEAAKDFLVIPLAEPANCSNSGPQAERSSDNC